MQFIRHLYKLSVHYLIYTIFLLTGISYAQYENDSWGEVRRQFKLNHELGNPSVQHQLRWLVSHPKYITKLAQAEPYLFHIITEVKKKNLPGEIALIPMLESAYNPFAYSGAGAAGLWQLMPKTGKNLGVKGDWWVDDRRNINSSTQAALNYFSHLNRFFHGDWLLAIAAYDCGEGTIQRLLKKMPKHLRSFWSLPLPQETQLYVPRLLALAEIIEHPERYRIRLPYIPHEPYFEEVNIRTQIDLNHAARLAGISFRDLMKLNPGFNHWTTSPNLPSTLLIPKKNVQQFHQNLSKIPPGIQKGIVQHTVQSGETLSIIANRYHTHISLIIKMNHLRNTSLRQGQVLYFPGSEPQYLAKFIPSSHRLSSVTTRKNPIAPKRYKILHIVQKNEDLYSVAHHYQISAHQIIAWNHLKSSNIHLGQHLFVWRVTHGEVYYTVKSGDTLGRIAQYNRLPLESLKRLNPKLNARYLRPGQKIKVV